MSGSSRGADEVVPCRSGAVFLRILLATLPGVSILAVAIGVLLVESVHLAWFLVPAMVAVAGALSAVQAATELSRFPARIVLRPSGLLLGYARFDIEAPWSDWSLGGRSRLTGGVLFRTRWGSPKGYFVTAEQARRIFLYPAAADWTGAADGGTFQEPGPRDSPKP